MKTVSHFINQHFPVFIGIYFILQIIIRLLTTNVAVLDESEQILFTQYFDFGYTEQPPIYTWIQMIIFKFFGTSIFGLSLLKNGLLFLTYLFVYKLGLLLTKDKLKASLSAISLMLIPQFVWDAQVDQTHTILLTTTTAITMYYFFKIAKGNTSLINFILLGVTSGIGLLAKYNFVLVLIAIAILSFIIKEFRSHFYKKKLIISIGIAFLLILPHFLWFISNFDIATQRTIDRMQKGSTENAIENFFKGSFNLLVAYIAFVTPFWIAFVVFFRKKFKFFSNNDTKAILLYGIIIFIFLFTIVVIGGATNIKERWLQPYLFLVPLFLFYHIQLSNTNTNIQKYLTLTLMAPIIVALVVLIRPFAIDVRGKPTRAAYPFDVLAQNIQKKVKDNQDLLIHAEDKYIGGNLKLFFPKSTVITPYLPNQPYTLKSKIIIVWTNEMPLKFLQKIEQQGYQCSKEKEKILYKYSKKLFYTTEYMICNKTI